MNVAQASTVPISNSLVANGAWAARPTANLQNWSIAAQDRLRPCASPGASAAPLASPVVAVATRMQSGIVPSVSLESAPLPSPPSMSPSAPSLSSMARSTSLKALPVTAVSAIAKDQASCSTTSIKEELSAMPKQPMRSSSVKTLSLASPQMGVRATSPSPGLPTRNMSPGVRVTAPAGNLGQSPMQSQAQVPQGYATPSAPGRSPGGLPSRPIVPGSPAPPGHRGAAQTPDRREPLTKTQTPTIRERAENRTTQAQTQSLTSSATRMRAVPMPVLRQRDPGRAPGPVRR